MAIFRKKYLINREFQVPFIIRMFFIAFTVSGLTYLANLIIFWRFNFLGQKMNLEENHQFYTFIHEQIKIMNATYVTISSIVFFLILLSGLFLSHRITGPLYNLKMNLRKLSHLKNLDGIQEISEVKFRKNDFFHDLSADFNLHLKNLKEIQLQRGQDTRTDLRILPDEENKDQAA